MKKVLFYLFIGIAIVGLLLNLSKMFTLLFNSIVSIAVFLLIIYLIYYFFFLSEDERKYRKAMRRTKRKRKFRN